MRGLRVLWLLAPVTTTALAAPAGSKSGSHQIYFPLTQDGGEEEGHIRLVLPIDKRGVRLAFDVVSHKRGSMKRVGFHWDPDDEAYEASVRARPNAEGTFDLVVV